MSAKIRFFLPGSGRSGVVMEDSEVVDDGNSPMTKIILRPASHSPPESIDCLATSPGTPL